MSRIFDLLRRLLRLEEAPVPCDPSAEAWCQSARPDGPCKCSCGGRNHGIGWDARQAARAAELPPKPSGWGLYG